MNGKLRFHRAVPETSSPVFYSKGAAERSAPEVETFVMERTSGERERAEPPGAPS